MDEVDRVSVDLVVRLVNAMLRLPFCDPFPGRVLEEVIAHIHDGERLGSYDFVDVLSQKAATGWQVKSTRASTPVTWKRAKIPDKAVLIANSHSTMSGAQALGTAIINFCNHHAAESVRKFGLKKLVYARLIDHGNGGLTYFERKLPLDGILFRPEDFVWSWSKQRKATKEQLSALHGIHRESDRPWFAWHGLSENQLHFKGERAWWPKAGAPTRIDFKRPTHPLTMIELAELLAD